MGSRLVLSVDYHEAGTPPYRSGGGGAGSGAGGGGGGEGRGPRGTSQRVDMTCKDNNVK